MLFPTIGLAQATPDDGELVYETYRRGAGALVDGIWRLELTAREVKWRPRGEGTPELTAHAFSVGDRPPQMPAPMIRVPAGTPVEVTVTNRLAKTLVLRGLTDRSSTRAEPEGSPLPPGIQVENLRLEPGATGSVRFTPLEPGSFFYYGRTLPNYAPEPDPPLSSFAVIPAEVFGGDGPDGPFIGPLIVDTAGAVPDDAEQVMLITRWADAQLDRTSWSDSWKMMINGRGWPATERLTYTVGDTVTWRVINASLQSHPMHLHGFFFEVHSRGDQVRDTTFEPSERWMAVTEWLDGLGGTMRVRWVPETPGNWLFHCHLIRHMTAVQRLLDEPRPSPHDHLDDHAQDGMAGMVMGITVRPRPDGEAVAEAEVERRIHLYTSRRDSVFGSEPAYSFILRDGDSAPGLDSVQIPGSPIVLERGEMTEIVVHNRLSFPFGVHWHGLELESRYDGVADWSGQAARAVPAIAPGDSFVVRMAPPRAGTFIYHVHSEPGHQLAQGMYGPFLVLEPGEPYDPLRDRVFVMGSEGTVPNEQLPVVNGVAEPGPLDLRRGETYRFRFINISSDDVKRVELLAGGEPAEWQLVAKDGADLPPARIETGSAVLPRIGVGETYDVLWTPETPGERALVVTTSFYGAAGRSPGEVTIPLRVGGH